MNLKKEDYFSSNLFGMQAKRRNSLDHDQQKTSLEPHHLQFNSPPSC